MGDAVTPAVAAAWDELDWLFAARLIGGEARLYAEAGVDGADPCREYLVAKKIADGHDTMSFILTPVDGLPARLPAGPVCDRHRRPA